MTYASLSACDEIVEVFEAVGASERVMQLLEAPPADQVCHTCRDITNYKFRWLTA